MVAAAELAQDRGRLVDGAGDEGGIFAVGGVVVAAVEDADCLAVFGGEGFEELDEALLVVNLGGMSVSMGWAGLTSSEQVGELTFNSGRFDIIAVPAKNVLFSKL